MPEKQKITRKLRAILSADVKGYSLLMADDEAHTIQTLKMYRSLMSDLINQHSGRVVDNPGDNLLAEFGSAVDATECAVAIQNRLKKENAKFVEDKKLQFRIGVNIGDVVQDGDRIYGSGVNVASRIESLADAGGICISRNTYDHIKNKIDILTKYLGEHEAKNIKEPVRVYKVLMDFDEYKPLVEEKLNLPSKLSIAVLPFSNMSGDPSQEYFSDGLTEQIINGLCKLPDLFVIARNSSFAYKGKPVSVKQIAQELGVKFILEGSLQKACNRLRITAQLIDATTDYHMWSENFDRELEDIFALQDEITLKIINIIQIKLTRGEQARLWEGMTKNIHAFDLFSRGIDLFLRFNGKDNQQSKVYFQRAIEIDKTYVFPYTLLGFCHINDIVFRWKDLSIESFVKAEKCAEQALAISDSCDLAHCLMSQIYLYKKQHDKAIKEAEKAIDLNPNGTEAHAMLGYIFSHSDNPELAIKLLLRAIRLNPIPHAYYYAFLAIAYRVDGNYEMAIKYAKKCLIKQPDMVMAHMTIAASYSSLDFYKEANNSVKKILNVIPDFSLNNISKVSPHKNKETLDKYIEALRKAGLPE